ncbi:MAG: dihydroneopterin aldolase [Lentisphaeria bacterium]|nr:dihydroneopterin aldolase [Lentisphaeria bacterium]
MDKIHIGGLELLTVIGTLPEEQERRQSLLLDLEIALDLAAAGRSDDLTQTIDYSEIESRMIRLAETTHFQLVEAFAQAAADIVMSYEKVAACTVTVTKPGASRRATVKVELNRTKA